YENGQMIYADSNKYTNGKEYLTKSGKKVYGGGGIMPDIFVPIDTSHFQRNVTQLYLDGTFGNFVYQYYSKRLPQFNQYTSPADFTKHYTGVEDAWTQLVNYALKDSINLKNVPAKDKDAIQKRLKAYLARFRWRNQGFYEVLNANDPVVQKAIQELAK
ncbi:MAG: carboxyl-terminal protease, partial [Bacteroidota bacterium]|nr:carboxyl-terminal protease [Bacteroidota bacterium]